MISAYQNLDAPHPHALQRFRPTTVPIKPRTSTESPPMFFTKSVKIVVVVTIFNFPESCEKSSQETRTTHNRRNKRSTCLWIGLLMLIFIFVLLFFSLIKQKQR